MSPRRDFTEDMRRLAAMLERRIEKYDTRHRRRLPISPEVSDILKDKRQNPGIFTVRDLATRVETTVGDLLNEPVLGEADQQKLRDFVDFLIARFDLIGMRAAGAREEKAFGVTETAFIERDYDYPRPLHAWDVPHAKGAAGEGIEADSESETTEVLHSIREVYTGELRVIRVVGESMAPILRDGDKVVFDTRLTSPRNDDVVAVYHHRDGGILGYWYRDDQEQFWLEKENEAFHRIRLDPAGGWTVFGTVTRLVERQIERRSRRRER
jgi:hypothetical protein